MNPDKDGNIAPLLHEIGCCHMNLQNYNEAITILNRSLEIKQNATLNPNKDKGIAATFYEIGRSCDHLQDYKNARLQKRCCDHLQDYKNAQTNFKQSLSIERNATLNPVRYTRIGRLHLLI